MTYEHAFQTGFGNYFESEALQGALPIGQNNPQKPPKGLYTEQLSGSAFTRPRSRNLRSWLYRIQPSVVHQPFSPYALDLGLETRLSAQPDQIRWSPLPTLTTPTTFVQGLKALLRNDQVQAQQGGIIYLYSANTSMETDYISNSDGEWLFVPYQGECTLATELGLLTLAPGEIAVIPRGVRFQVKLNSPEIKGYLLENLGLPLELPELGPIGANGLANPQDFQTPVAYYEDKSGEFLWINKFQNTLWQAQLTSSPLNVVAWRGNYAPYKYDLSRFNTVNTVSFDHPDPSIFTVLTSPSGQAGIANIDFVIFPERWMVAENTFRPPYFHRNIMSEYMGLIKGQYDAKADGFVPGGGSLHNCMSPHGPDAATTEKAMHEKLAPQKQTETLAFMFESCAAWAPTTFALEGKLRQKNYQDCWKHMPRFFS